MRKGVCGVNKLITPSATILLVAAVALLGLYSMGVIGGADIRQADGKEYASGNFVYSGGLENGLFDEYGVISFENGDSYSGYFTDGRFDARGVYSHVGDSPEDNWRFEGIFKDGQPASGVFYFANGEETAYESGPAAGADRLISETWDYDGAFNERGQKGTGTFTFADGSTYKGGFSQGLADGEGAYADSVGNPIYGGSFRAGLFEGQGVYHSPEGWVYKGGFKAGLFDGEGSVASNVETVRGVWEKGVQVTRYE